MSNDELNEPEYRVILSQRMNRFIDVDLFRRRKLTQRLHSFRFVSLCLLYNCQLSIDHKSCLTTLHSLSLSRFGLV